MAIADEIARIEAILNEGVTQVTTDGVTVRYDHAELRRRLLVLKNQQDATKRPRKAGFDLSGAF